MNPEDKSALVFNRVLESLIAERMEQNDEIFARFMNDEGFQKLVGAWLVGEVYRRLQTPLQESREEIGSLRPA